MSIELSQTGYTPVDPDAPDLVARQRAGALYWRDPEPLPPRWFGADHYRYVRLHKHREDFTPAILKLWAERGELFERAPLKESSE